MRPRFAPRPGPRQPTPPDQAGDCANDDCANAVGAATAQISGETDQVYRDLSRADAIAAAEAQAIARATEAGADPATITVIEVEDMPLAYLPGNALRVRVRVAGEMLCGE